MREIYGKSNFIKHIDPSFRSMLGLQDRVSSIEVQPTADLPEINTPKTVTDGSLTAHREHYQDYGYFKWPAGGVPLCTLQFSEGKKRFINPLGPPFPSVVTEMMANILDISFRNGVIDPEKSMSGDPASSGVHIITEGNSAPATDLSECAELLARIIDLERQNRIFDEALGLPRRTIN